MQPGIHERIYEFCFNTAFCQCFNALLATHPSIPSQRMERDLGYDVEFKIRQEGYSTSIFLQYKVVHYVDRRMKTNARFYDAHHGAYYRFPIKLEQYKTLRRLAQHHADVYYCAPMFYTSAKLTECVTQGNIYTHSVILPLQNMPPVQSGPHNITYDAAGHGAKLHSETHPIDIFRQSDYAHPRDWRDWPVRRVEGFGRPQVATRSLDDLSSLAEILSDAAFSGEDMSSREINRDYKIVRDLRSPIAKLQYMLGHMYEVSWLLLKP
jgi:hypothetical protein